MQSPVKFTRRKGKVSVGNESYLSAQKGPSLTDQKNERCFFDSLAVSVQTAGISFLFTQAYSLYFNGIIGKLNLSPYHHLLNC